MQTQTFVHRNSEAYQARILGAETNKSQQLGALRIFLDCFYAECGYIPWHMRDTRADARPCLLSDCLEYESYSEEEENIYTRFGAVMNSLPNISQLDEYL
jgi:hypothetical protein